MIISTLCVPQIYTRYTNHYIIYPSRPEKLAEIHEVLFTSPETTHVLASNVAPLQPLAATAMKDGFRSKSVVETASAELRSKNPSAIDELILGDTRYTLYHGTDCYLWISYTWGEYQTLTQ